MARQRKEEEGRGSFPKLARGQADKGAGKTHIPEPGASLHVQNIQHLAFTLKEMVIY